MPSCELPLTFLVVVLAAAGAAMPQDDGKKDTGFGLPFIQFTNGGIRFNFAGYHAEAGLGGLLTGSRTGGGLHASAGTPWGANAAAGLGGALGGDDGTAGGGLYARAGLGEGRPSASAGLGGTLDGSGRTGSAASGGLFARAGLGGGIPDAAAGLAGSVNGPAAGDAGASAGASADAGAGAGAAGAVGGSKAAGGRTSIQIVSKGEKRKENRRQAQQMVSAPTIGAGIFGEVLVNPVPIDVMLTKGFETFKYGNGAGEVANVPAAPPAPTFSNEAIPSNAIATTEVAFGVSKSKTIPAYERTSFRKRLWSRLPKRRVVYASPSDDGIQTEAYVSANSRKIVTRQADYVPREENVARDRQQSRNDGGVSDIFNIPISTLTAVDRLFQHNPA